MTRIPDGSVHQQSALANSLRERRILAESMLRELESPKRELSKWELSFVESVQEVLTSTYRISDAQLETLKRIYADKT